MIPDESLTLFIGKLTVTLDQLSQGYRLEVSPGTDQSGLTHPVVAHQDHLHHLLAGVLARELGLHHQEFESQPGYFIRF